MGRLKNSPEERNAIMASYINAATEMIDEGGIESVSIRKVSARAGFSSATMYLYFEGLDELIALASIGYLRDYVGELSKYEMEAESPRDTYYRTWEVFAKHTFTRPSIFMHLFFELHSKPLGDIVKEYYSIFPHELDQVSGTMLSMLMAGDMSVRNMRILAPYAESLNMDEKATELANEITVSYYHALLSSAYAKEMTPAEVDNLVAHFVEGAHFILKDD